MEWEEALIDFLKERQKDPEKSRYMDIAFYTERSVLLINVGPKISKIYDIHWKPLSTRCSVPRPKHVLTDKM